MTRRCGGLGKDRSARCFPGDLDGGDAQHMPRAAEILLPLQHPTRRDRTVTRFSRRSAVERNDGVRDRVSIALQSSCRVCFDAMARPEQSKILFKDRERLTGIARSANVKRRFGRDHREHVINSSVFSSLNERLGRGACFFGGRGDDGANDRNSDARDEHNGARQRPPIVVTFECNPHHYDANGNEGTTQEERIFQDVSAHHGVYGIEVGGRS